MSASFDAVSHLTGAAVSTRSFTHTPVGTPSAVILGYYSQKVTNATTGDAPSAAPTYGGVSSTLIQTVTDATSHLRIGWYYQASPAAGAQTASITWAAAQAGCALVAVTVTGDAATNPASTQVASNPGNSTTGSCTPVAPGANDLVLFIAASNTGGAGWTTGAGMSSGQVQMFVDNASNNDWVADYRPGSSGSAALTHTQTTGTWFASTVTLAAAAAAVAVRRSVIVSREAQRRSSRW